MHLGSAQHGVVRQVGVGILDAFADQIVHLGLLRQVGVAGVGDVATFRPVAHRAHVDVDEAAHFVEAVAEHHRLLDVRDELELVLDVVGRKQVATGQLADILGAVDDLEVPVLVEEAGVAGMEIAFAVDGLGGVLRPFVIFLEQHRAAHQHFAVVGDPDLDARRRLADAVELDFAVRLQTHRGAGFRRSVELLQVDADGTVKAEQVRPDRRAGGVGDADAAHAEDVAQRPVHQQIAQRIEQPVGGEDTRLAIENLRAAAPRHRHEGVEHAALDGAGVFHADHHRGQQVLEHPWRCEIIGRADLAQVGHHRVAGFRAIDGETGHHRLGVGKQVVADPGHRQVRENVVFRAKPVECATALRRRDERSVSLAYAFRLAGGAGGIQHHGDIAGTPQGDLAVEKIGLRPVVNAAHLNRFVQTLNEGLGIVAHAARVIVKDMVQRRAVAHDFKQFVDLLLVLDDGELDPGVLQDKSHLLRHRVLVQRHRHAAQHLCRAHRPVQARPVVADDGEVVAALETKRGQAAGHRPRLRGNLAPGPGLPDTQVFFARGRTVAADAGMVQQQTWKGVERVDYPTGRRSCHGSISSCVALLFHQVSAHQGAAAIFQVYCTG